MSSLTNSIASPVPPKSLRPLDVRRDLNAVANLVEECFSTTLDPDGQRYLRQMRDAARSTSFLHWAETVVDQATLPLSGFVWEENGRLVGNLSLIPFNSQGRRMYLIANVAVSEPYRGKGIGRALTAAALDHLRRKGLPNAWLHVREDNPIAIHIYESLGFVEKAHRATWQFLSPPADIPPDQLQKMAADGYCFGLRTAAHWPQQRLWLDNLYPGELQWNLPIDRIAIQGGLFGRIHALLNGVQVRHWVVQKDGQLLSAVTWQRSNLYADHLWLAIPPAYDEMAVSSLLQVVSQKVTPGHPLSIDFPARVAEKAIEQAGFRIHQVLIWMEVKLKD
jgi:GNAT superfamily N-acetyltransferase